MMIRVVPAITATPSMSGVAYTKSLEPHPLAPAPGLPYFLAINRSART